MTRIATPVHISYRCVFLQLLDVDPQDQAEEDGGHMDLDSQRKGKCAVIKTSTRQVHIHLEIVEHKYI